MVYRRPAHSSLGGPAFPVKPDAGMGLHWQVISAVLDVARLGTTLGHEGDIRSEVGRGNGADRRRVTRDEFDDPSRWLDIAVFGGRIVQHLRLACRCTGLNAVVWRGAAGRDSRRAAGAHISQSNPALRGAKLFTALFPILALVVVGEVAVVWCWAAPSAGPIRNRPIQLVRLGHWGRGAAGAWCSPRHWLLAGPRHSQKQPEL